jgi:hypothetical protein
MFKPVWLIIQVQPPNIVNFYYDRRYILVLFSCEASHTDADTNAILGIGS